MAVDKDERQEIERQLQENGYVTIDDVPFTVKQLALLNTHKLTDLESQIEELDRMLRGLVEKAPDQWVSRRDFDSYRTAMRAMFGVIAALVVGLGSIMVAIAH